MKRLTLIVFMAAILISSAVFADNVMKIDRELGSSFIGYAPDRCIITLKEGKAGNFDNNSLSAIDEKFEVGYFERQFPMAGNTGYWNSTDLVLERKYKARFPEGQLDQVMEAYRNLSNVEKVEPVGMYLVYATPNDGYYDDPPPEYPYDQWHYWDTYGMGASLAWDQETGSSDVVCAVIDGGVRYYHYDLGGTNPPGPNDNSTNGNIWVNNGEIPGNGIDDDNNGYVDDVIGYDFVDGGNQCTDTDCGTVDNDPRDHGGHGTHVAGTIAAITNNDPTFGVAGVAGGWNNGTTDDIANGVKIMCLRAGFSTRRGGVMYMDMVAEALYYIATMVDKGVNVAAVNCSWGSSEMIGPAIDAVLARDVMVIVACGNANNTTADYLGTRDDCLDVGATDSDGYAASFTTYGTWVDVAAPGVGILSTYHNADDPDGDYISTMDGTSMSCPHVVGLAGLLESKDPSLTGPEKFDLIVNNTNPYYGTKYIGTGIIDAKKALDAVGPSENPPIAEFSGTPTSGYAPMNVSFTDLSTNNPTSWNWDFGDGVGTSTQQNPTYIYNNVGTYTVTLTVSNAFGNDSEVKTDYINVQTEPQDPPVANFSGTPTSGFEPLTVNFTDLSTFGPTTWNWDFGDGVGTSTQQNPSYNYTSYGTYTVSLTVTNAYGSDTETKLDYISVQEQQAVTMHVQDITVSRIPAGRNCTGRGVVTIYDGANAPLSGATVYVSVTGNTTQSLSGVTGSDGTVTLTTLKTKTCDGEWCFEVTNVVLTSGTYDSGSNLVTMACESGPVYNSQVGNYLSLPTGFALEQNYPNPFNPTTEIQFVIPNTGQIILEIYNLVGQRVAILADGEYPAGRHSITWDASNVASGVYLYRLNTDSGVLSKKMVLLK